jgi:hypothetical protein
MNNVRFSRSTVSGLHRRQARRSFTVVHRRPARAPARATPHTDGNGKYSSYTEASFYNDNFESNDGE